MQAYVLIVETMSSEALLEWFKARQPTVYQIASEDFQYDNEAISLCLIKRFRLTGEVKFECAGDLIGMLFDNL